MSSVPFCITKLLSLRRGRTNAHTVCMRRTKAFMTCSIQNMRESANRAVWRESPVYRTGVPAGDMICRPYIVKLAAPGLACGFRPHPPAPLSRPGGTGRPSPPGPLVPPWGAGALLRERGRTNALSRSTALTPNPSPSGRGALTSLSQEPFPLSRGSPSGRGGAVERGSSGRSGRGRRCSGRPSPPDPLSLRERGGSVRKVDTSSPGN